MAGSAKVGAEALDAAVIVTRLGQVAGFLGMGAMAGAWWAVSTIPAGGESEREFEAWVNANLPSESKTDGKSLDGKAAEAEPATVKAVPSPNGRRGGEPHQAGVAAAEAELKEKYGDDPTATVGTEVKVSTPGGKKETRYLDVGVKAGTPRTLVEGVQVGKQTQGGVPISRERQAIDDIAKAKPGATVTFRPYNR